MPKTKDLLLKETWAIPQSSGGRIRIALAFPNTYYVGMSSLGFQLLYRLLSRTPGITCERVFLPNPKTIHPLKKRNSPLTSLESGRPLTSFHAVAFSISFENDYINILTMLDLAKIPLMQKKRSEKDPLIIGGGISVFLNPEPLADFFDMFIIGEAEEVIGEFLAVLKEHHNTKTRSRNHLADFAKIGGVYIPSSYDVTYSDDGLIQKFLPAEGFAEKIKRRRVTCLDEHPASSCIITPHTEFSNMALLEISRGCPRSCRFCAAGNVNLPYRTRQLSHLQESIQALVKEQTKIGILGSAVSDHPGLRDLIKAITDHGGRASISSLRADAVTEEIVSMLKKSNQKTFTIAPEAGSERLRQAICKNLPEETIFRAVKIFSQHKVPNIKLYFLIGLPSEKPEDIDAIIKITKHIKHLSIQESKSDRWLKQITLSINAFIPKPFTPFQWHPFENVKDLKHKFKVITKALKKEKKVFVHHDLPKWGYIQTLLSRGDRRVGKILLKAFEYDGDWSIAFKESDINPDFYVYRQKTFDEILPWDFIDHDADKSVLWSEYRKALRDG